MVVTTLMGIHRFSGGSFMMRAGIHHVTSRISQFQSEVVVCCLFVVVVCFFVFLFVCVFFVCFLGGVLQRHNTQTLPCPACSPDLNQENVYGMLGINVYVWEIPHSRHFRTVWFCSTLFPCIAVGKLSSGPVVS